MDRGGGKNAVEESMLVQLRCANGAVFAFDVLGGYVGEEERWWFETISTRGSTRLAPLRVVKELHGRPTDVSPRGAAARESAFIQSYRAELAHFAAVIAGEAEYEAPVDQMVLHRIVEGDLQVGGRGEGDPVVSPVRAAAGASARRRAARAVRRARLVATPGAAAPPRRRSAAPGRQRDSKSR